MPELSDVILSKIELIRLISSVLKINRSAMTITNISTSSITVIPDIYFLSVKNLQIFSFKFLWPEITQLFIFIIFFSIFSCMIIRKLIITRFLSFNIVVQYNSDTMDFWFFPVALTTRLECIAATFIWIVY